MVNLKAVIIEDDVNSARVLSHLLAKEAIGSTIVTDVIHLDQHLTTDTDIVFVDLEMPGKNGYEVLDELLNEAHFSSIPIIASSVHTNEIHHARQAGFHSFIGKPLAKDIFPEQLKRILEGENVWEI